MATWPPKAVDGAVDEMSKSIRLFSAVQGHVTRAKNNLVETLAQEHVNAESIQHAVTSLEEKLKNFNEKQLAVAALCADATQLTVLDERMNSIVTDADAVLRDAVTRKGKLTLIPGLGPKYSVLRYFGTRVPILQYSSVLSTHTFKKYLYSYLYSSTSKRKVFLTSTYEYFTSTSYLKLIQNSSQTKPKSLLQDMKHSVNDSFTIRLAIILKNDLINTLKLFQN